MCMSIGTKRKGAGAGAGTRRTESGAVGRERGERKREQGLKERKGEGARERERGGGVKRLIGIEQKSKRERVCSCMIDTEEPHS